MIIIMAQLMYLNNLLHQLYRCCVRNYRERPALTIPCSSDAKGEEQEGCC